MLPPKIFLNKTHTPKRFVKFLEFSQQEALLSSLLHPTSSDSFSLFSSNHLVVKTALYRFLKRLKDVKIGRLSSSRIDSFSYGLQENLLVVRSGECKKKQKLRKLREKIKKASRKRKGFLARNSVGRANLKISLGLSNLLRWKTLERGVSKKRLVLLKLLKARHFFNKILEHRLVSYRAGFRKKKKYKKLVLFLKKNKRSFKALLRTYAKNFALHVDKRKQKKKLFKKLLRRQKRRVKWKRKGIFRFFRSRHRFPGKFFVPRHFEINYKTLDAVYLGKIDYQNLDFRMPFWLNLRRLVTLLSS